MARLTSSMKCPSGPGCARPVAGDGSGPRGESQGDSDPGLGGVAFLQNGRSAQSGPDPSADEQPEVPEYVPGRRS